MGTLTFKSRVLESALCGSTILLQHEESARLSEEPFLDEVLDGDAFF